MNEPMVLFSLNIYGFLILSTSIILWFMASKIDRLEAELKDFREKVGV